MSDFQLQPGFMESLRGAQTGAASMIEGSYSSLTSGQLAAWSAVYGPLAIGNMIEALHVTSASNLMSALTTAFNHTELGIATGVVETTHIATDTITGV